MTIWREDREDLSSVLEVNRPIQVVIRQEKNDYVYRSSVGDFDKGSILITPITRDGLPAQLQSGENINIIYYGRDALYEFTTHVTGRKKENNVLLTILENPHKCSRVQRRDFYRLVLNLEAYYRRVTIEEQDVKKVYVPSSKSLPCYLEDLSGGGLAFYTSERLDDDTHVEIEFILPATGDDDDNHIREMIKIVRTKKVNPLDRKGSFEYTYGASFVSIDEEMQTKIIRFIIRKQIELKKVQEE